jgi:hypothetical protein
MYTKQEILDKLQEMKKLMDEDENIVTITQVCDKADIYPNWPSYIRKAHGSDIEITHALDKLYNKCESRFLTKAMDGKMHHVFAIFGLKAYYNRIEYEKGRELDIKERNADMMENEELNNWGNKEININIKYPEQK